MLFGFFAHTTSFYVLCLHNSSPCNFSSIFIFYLLQSVSLLFQISSTLPLPIWWDTLGTGPASVLCAKPCLSPLYTVFNLLSFWLLTTVPKYLKLLTFSNLRSPIFHCPVFSLSSCSHKLCFILKSMAKFGIDGNNNHIIYVHKGRIPIRQGNFSLCLGTF